MNWLAYLVFLVLAGCFLADIPPYFTGPSSSQRIYRHDYIAKYNLRTPPIQGNPAGVNLDAPLSEWNMVSSHSTASQCQEALAQLKQMAKHIELKAGVTDLEKRSFEMAQCVAVGDPRLKEK